MRRIVSAAAVAGLALGLAGCGHNTEQRAATGAGTGLLIAGPVGAAVGAGVGVMVSKSKGSTSKSSKKR